MLYSNLDSAVADLEEAVQKAPGEASLLSDLSALYGERARAKDRPEDYVASLEMADRALSLKPGLAEAMFNRGVALEHLFLYTNANDAWGRYLEIEPSLLGPLPIGYADSNTPWAAEARSRFRVMNRLANPRVYALSIGRELRRVQAPLSAIEGGSSRGEFPLLEMGSVKVGTTGTSVLNDSADAMELLGKSIEAWRYRYRALELSGNQEPSGPQMSDALRSFRGATLDSLAQRRTMAALEFQSCAVWIARLTGEGGQIVEALLDRARIEVALGKQQEAKRDFSQALNAMNAMEDHVPQAREALAASFDVVQREIDESEDRAAAITLELKPSAQLGALADLDFQRGDATGAEKNLGRALDELDRKRAKVAPGSDRVSFFDQAQPLYMRMVALQLHLGRPEMALEALERFRARTLLDQMDREKPSAPLSWRDLSQRLPAQTTILVYAVVEGRLITWIVRPTGISVSPHQPGWNAVSALVQRLPEILDGRQTADLYEILEPLYRELVEPASRETRAGDRIIFVPTRSLYSIPFAALRAPGSGRFLVQDHAVGVAPSVSEFVAAVERDRWLSAEPIASALLVGDPSFNRQLAPQLPSTPGMAREIESLSTIYHGLDLQVLTKRAATPSRVLDSLGRYDIAHLAVHGQQDREDPTRSRLVLSTTGKEPGDLSVKDILRARLTRTRLVFLAACDTQAGPVSESEGSLSLAHAFLAAGAPAVVGSLWHVTDGSTERLSVRFHQELLRGADALSALRTAQLAELSSHPDGSDWTWASFQVFGGVEARNR
ncbi:MAG TPA: CHAT domain-containing protein [Thermoanaerobaculia bacterium]|nr:CHAT domain-containing protein [Thermoanaerobaculia bacterium]